MLEKGRKQQLIFLDVVDLKIGGFIEDLNAVTVGTVEQLFSSVGGIGNIVARRMPIWIDTEAKRLISLGVVGGKGKVAFGI